MYEIKANFPNGKQETIAWFVFPKIGSVWNHRVDELNWKTFSVVEISEDKMELWFELCV